MVIAGLMMLLAMAGVMMIFGEQIFLIGKKILIAQLLIMMVETVLAILLKIQMIMK